MHLHHRRHPLRTIVCAAHPALLRWCGVALLCLLSACTTPPQNPSVSKHWQGKLAVRVFSSPVQGFASNFDLQGDSQSGELVLSSPIGSTLAQLQWSPQSASLQTDAAQAQEFGSLSELIEQATGVDIPVASLFDWLDGKPTEVAGWSVDMQDLDIGKLMAQRHSPKPQAELKVVFEH